MVLTMVSRSQLVPNAALNGGALTAERMPEVFRARCNRSDTAGDGEVEEVS